MILVAALFNDLFKAVCGGNSITNTEGFENCRVAVLQKPFLFFVQEDENSEPQFKSFMTFGPGKGDKPTFGYDKTKFPDYVVPAVVVDLRPLHLCLMTQHIIEGYKSNINYEE